MYTSYGWMKQRRSDEFSQIYVLFARLLCAAMLKVYPRGGGTGRERETDTEREREKSYVRRRMNHSREKPCLVAHIRMGVTALAIVVSRFEFTSGAYTTYPREPVDRNIHALRLDEVRIFHFGRKMSMEIFLLVNRDNALRFLILFPIPITLLRSYFLLFIFFIIVIFFCTMTRGCERIFSITANDYFDNTCRRSW